MLDSAIGHLDPPPSPSSKLLRGTGQDLTGTRFGKLLVRERAPENHGNNAAWVCQCDCGRVKTYISSFLRRKGTSCGEGACRRLVENLVGQRFGRLTVLEYAGKIDQRTHWKCICDCGEYKIALAKSLKNGSTSSCDCLNRELASLRRLGKGESVEIGKRFGKLTVVTSVFVGGRTMWKCICDCGRSTITRANLLKLGRAGSCRCAGGDRLRTNTESRVLRFDAGQRFGKLVILKHIQEKGAYRYQCECDCGNITEPKASDLLDGTTKSCGCLKSQLELDLLQFIRDQLPGTEVVHNTRKVIGPVELDVWIPSKKLAIEFDGLYWHGESIDPSKKLKSHKKHLACRALGIRLVTIFEDEWNTKRTAVEGYLRSILGKKKTIGARKCAIEKTSADTFFAEHHLQGSVRGKHYQLTMNGEVVAAAAFSKATKSKAMAASDVWELTRYAALPELSVAGGASRLLQAFLRDTPECAKVISYSDNRWSAGGMYEAMGFKCTVESKPSFSYFRNSTSTRVHRFNWRKSEALRVYGGSSEETEWEIMQRNGWDRIWDCGKKRWELDVTTMGLR